MPIFPQWYIDLDDKLEPYRDGAYLREDAPEWAKEGQKKLDAWLHEVTDGVM